ncbi:MAG: DinB family protein, partial [Planctomycetota bacterium]
MLPPDEPAGSLQDVENFDPEIKLALIDELAKAPENLRKAVRGLTDQQLDTKYKNWTIRQITHHVADSHTHSYIRFKWTLNEDTPTIKAYDEAVWVTAPDCVAGDVNAPLA